jgi:DNA-binding GntR family transcriptional regulator
MEEPQVQPIQIQRETLVDRLVDLLQDSILKGKIMPTSRLSESSVAKTYGVSRVPAREALQRIEEMGLVRKNHLGREVIKFSKEEFSQIYELKNVIEAYGTAKGAEIANDQEMEHLRSIFEKMEKSFAAGDSAQLGGLNYQFHDFMVSCCRNAKLIETHKSLVKQVRWATSLSLKLPDRSKESIREHKAIFNAFLKRDIQRLKSLIETHSENNRMRVLSQMESMEQEQN